MRLKIRQVVAFVLCVMVLTVYCLVRVGAQQCGRVR